MIEIRVIEITEGPKKGKWIWKVKKSNKPNSNGKWIGRSIAEFIDAWEANASARKMKKGLEENN